MAKVSICIPTYNRPDCLKRLLESVFSQTYKDYDIIITDNSDGNSVLDIVNNYSGIKYYKNRKNIGMTNNINKSIKCANGEYIKLMFSDDWFTSTNSLELMVSMLEENPTTNFAFCGSLRVGKQGNSEHFMENKIAKDIKRDPCQLFLGNKIGAPSATIYRRNNLYFDKILEWLVDLEFYIRILKINNNFVFTKDTLVSIGINNEQVTNIFINDNKLIMNESIYVYKKLGLKRDKAYRNYLTNLLIRHSASYKYINKQDLDYIIKFNIYKNMLTNKLGLYFYKI